MSKRFAPRWDSKQAARAHESIGASRCEPLCDPHQHAQGFTAAPHLRHLRTSTHTRRARACRRACSRPDAASPRLLSHRSSAGRRGLTAGATPAFERARARRAARRYEGLTRRRGGSRVPVLVRTAALAPSMCPSPGEVRVDTPTPKWAPEDASRALCPS